MTNILEFPNRKKSVRHRKATIGYRASLNEKKEIESEIMIEFEDGAEHVFSIEAAVEIQNTLAVCIIRAMEYAKELILNKETEEERE